jgi:hypothetical protein
VGDVAVGVNGQRAKAASDLLWLAEKHIHRPKILGTWSALWDRPTGLMWRPTVGVPARWPMRGEKR